MNGHATWLDWPWKLHSILDKSGNVRNEIYRLDTDPQESLDMISDELERAFAMKLDLKKWQESIVKSMNGDDC